MDQFSYAFGVTIGKQLANMGVKKMLNVDDFAAALKDLFEGADLKIDEKMAETIVESTMTASQGMAFKQEGEEFLANNAAKEGVVVTDSGLQYTVLREGTGKSPKATDRVRCHYQGTLVNGTVFDSSYSRNEPADFPLNGVIKGWTEGLQLMKEGAKYRFFIPYNLAYGSRGAGQSIPPYSALIFDVELLRVL